MKDKKLSKNFWLHEFLCPCCGEGAPVIALVDLLQQTRNYYEKQVIIKSGFRCLKHNATIKGASKMSQHLLNKAADIVIPGVTPMDVFAYLYSIMRDFGGGLKLYETHVHVDVRDGCYRAIEGFRNERYRN